MATTSIWSVKGWLGKLVIYIENPEKTKNPAYFEKQGMTTEQAQGLSDVIDYASQDSKTQLSDEQTEITRRFVSAINCHTDTARDEMMATKAHYDKTEGVVAYHGYQSFAIGEATPEIAHEIGIKLAERLWGDKYQVLVATHLDKGNHLHNHFVLNNVSMIDGKKYYRSESDYYNMQKQSDTLCYEYGLSVIEDAERGKSKHYGEWKAEKENRPTYRSLIKGDLDKAIAESMTERQLWDNLYKKGYHIKFGKDITLRPEGKDRGLKLRRNFGDDYGIDAIRRRILSQSRPDRQRGAGHNAAPGTRLEKRIRVVGNIYKAKKMTGLRALYFYYLYRMGVLPKRKEPNPKRVYFLFREDIRHMQSIARETRLLVTNKIDTAEQLAAYKESVTAKIITLSGNRKKLRYRLRSIKDEGELAAAKTEIAALSEKIGELRQEVRLCEGIEKRSGEMKEKLHRANEAEKSERKEPVKHESFRGRR